MAERISIIVRLQFEGIHSWPDAPQDLPESYLSLPHRHVFHVEAVRLVRHAERDIEIIKFKRDMKEFCEKHLCGPHNLSCENMAWALLRQFELKSCRVLEDGENGAVVEAI